MPAVDVQTSSEVLIIAQGVQTIPGKREAER
jgi:hypothetical protein